MNEEWKEYKTYKRLRSNKFKLSSYLRISNFGNVEGVKWKFKDFEDDMIVYIDGRKCIKNHHYPVYLIVWTTFNGPVPKGYVVHHIDHNKLNDRLDNLTLLTKSEHMSHHNKGKIISEDTKQKHRIHRHSEKTKRKISESHKGKHLSELTRQKISNTLKRNYDKQSMESI